MPNSPGCALKFGNLNFGKLVSDVWSRSLNETIQDVAVLCTLQGKNLNTLPAAALLSFQVYSSFLDCIGLKFYLKHLEPK